MEEEKKQEENKDNKKKHWKLKVGIVLSLSMVVILLTAIYLTFLITHKDTNRNKITISENSNTELIQKNLIEGFKDIKDSGRYSFRLPDDDINKILLNSSSDLLSSKDESCYIDSSTSTFYVDLKPTLGVSTRVCYAFKEYAVTNTNEHIFKCEATPTMGKLPYVFGHRITFESFFEEVSKRSGLPIRFEDAMLTVSPIKLFEYFPNDNIKSFVNGLISSKPECISIDPNSLFGFDINLSLFSGASIPSKEVSELLPDLHSRVTNSLNTEFLDSIGTDESKEACFISVLDINKVISSKFVSKVIENASFDFVDVSVKLTVDDLYISLTDTGHLSIVMPVSINGYKMYFLLSSDIITFSNDMMVKFQISGNTTLKDVTFTKDSYIGNMIISSLRNVFEDVSSEYSYIKYVSSDSMLSIDFTDIQKSITELRFFYKSTIVPVISSESGFSVVVTSLA